MLSSVHNRRPSLRATLVALAAAAAFGLVVHGQARAEGEAETGAPQWVATTQDYALDQSRTVTLRGTKTGPGSCIFSYPELELPVGEDALESRQLSADFSTCDATFEIGKPPQSVVSGLRAESMIAAKKAALNENPSTNVRRLASHQVRAAKYKVWWRDLPGLELNSTSSHVTFLWGHSCATAVARYSLFSWASWSGWIKNYGYGSNQTACNEVSRTSYAKFTNSTFCAWAGLTSRTYYQGIRATGKSNGAIAGAITGYSQFTGACAPVFAHTMLWS